MDRASRSLWVGFVFLVLVVMWLAHHTASTYNDLYDQLRVQLAAIEKENRRTSAEGIQALKSISEKKEKSVEKNMTKLGESVQGLDEQWKIYLEHTKDLVFQLTKQATSLDNIAYDLQRHVNMVQRRADSLDWELKEMLQSLKRIEESLGEEDKKKIKTHITNLQNQVALLHPNTTDKVFDSLHTKVLDTQNLVLKLINDSARCSLPKDWCTSGGSAYRSVDCDGDGLADHTCYDGLSRGTILSKSKCQDTWPYGVVDECIPIWDFRNISKVAVLVETRFSPELVSAVQNFLKILPSEWKIQIFHAGIKPEQLKGTPIANEFEKGRILLTTMPGTLPTAKELYSDLLSSPRFWEEVKGEKALVFQVDSVLCSKSIYKVDDFIAFDYIGAPWCHDPIGFNHLSYYGGNGGLSLRTRAMMHRCTTTVPNRPGFPEDVYFSLICLPKVNGCVADRPPSARFSVEGCYSIGSAGVHQPWLGGPGIRNEAQKFMMDLHNFCPEYQGAYGNTMGPPSPADAPHDAEPVNCSPRTLQMRKNIISRPMIVSRDRT